MVKFGVRVWIWDTLPAPHFVKIAQGICPLGEYFFTKNFKFTRFLAT